LHITQLKIKDFVRPEKKIGLSWGKKREILRNEKDRSRRYDLKNRLHFTDEVLF
jgi:hypothetical protein